MIDLYSLHKQNIEFDHRYQLRRKLGGGGFSEVWLAYDKKSQTEVALKVFTQTSDLDEDGIEMFRNEFSIVCQFNHTNILRPFSFETVEEHPYLVLPYCQRGSASQFIGKISEDEVWHFINDVASGLDYLHSNLERPIVHQDIKPANILIDINNQFVITDFGISTGLHRTLSRKNSPSDNDKSGTIAYMAPERFTVNAIPIISSDIWSLGATLYELVTGDVPFGEFGGLTQSKVHDIEKIKGDYSNGLKNLIYSCLSEKTWERPSARDLIDAVSHRTLKLNKSHQKIRLYTGLFVSILTFCGIGGYFFSKYKEKNDLISAQVMKNDSIAENNLSNARNLMDLEWNNALKSSFESINDKQINKAINIYNSTEISGCSDSVKTIFLERMKEDSLKVDSICKFFKSKEEEYTAMEASVAANMFTDRLKRMDKIDYKPYKSLNDEQN